MHPHLDAEHPPDWEGPTHQIAHRDISTHAGLRFLTTVRFYHREFARAIATGPKHPTIYARPMRSKMSRHFVVFRLC
jgi:hypothetical protein